MEHARNIRIHKRGECFNRGRMFVDCHFLLLTAADLLLGLMLQSVDVSGKPKTDEGECAEPPAAAYGVWARPPTTKLGVCCCALREQYGIDCFSSCRINCGRPCGGVAGQRATLRECVCRGETFV